MGIDVTIQLDRLSHDVLKYAESYAIACVALPAKTSSEKRQLD